jgi:TRAP-type transport system small permease protein
LDTALRVIRETNRGLHYISGALITLMMLFTVYNILGRWLFNRPLRGTVELTQLSMIAIVYLAFAYAQHRDDHISVDLLYVRLGDRAKAVLDAIGSVIGVVVLALLAWRLYAYSETLQLGGRTTATRRIPLYPLAYVAIVGTVAYLLAIVATAIERMRGERPDSPLESAASDDGEV